MSIWVKLGVDHRVTLQDFLSHTSCKKNIETYSPEGFDVQLLAFRSSSRAVRSLTIFSFLQAKSCLNEPDLSLMGTIILGNYHTTKLRHELQLCTQRS